MQDEEGNVNVEAGQKPKQLLEIPILSLESHVDLNKYQLEEGSVQVKHIPIVLID